MLCAEHEIDDRDSLAVSWQANYKALRFDPPEDHWTGLEIWCYPLAVTIINRRFYDVDWGRWIVACNQSDDGAIGDVNQYQRGIYRV